MPTGHEQLNVGRNIYRCRRSRDFTAEDLGRQVGVEREEIIRIEAGTAPLTESLLRSIADALGVQLEALREVEPRLPGGEEQRIVRELQALAGFRYHGWTDDSVYWVFHGAAGLLSGSQPADDDLGELYGGIPTRMNPRERQAAQELLGHIRDTYGNIPEASLHTILHSLAISIIAR